MIKMFKKVKMYTVRPRNVHTIIKLKFGEISNCRDKM